jgi:hypothetical protein
MFPEEDRQPAEAISMKTASLLAAALVTLTTLPLAAQQADAAAKQTTTANASGIPANPSAIAGAGADISRHTAQSKPEVLQPVFAQLMGNLDSKSAKLGDPIELRTQSQMKTADGTAIPKGTKIMGRVTAVLAHSKDSQNQNAQVAVQFDRLVLKGGQSVAIRSEIQWVAPPPSASTADMLRSQSNIGGGVMGDATQVAGGNNGGGLGTGGAGGYSQVGGHFVTTDSMTQRPGSVTNYGMQAPPSNGQPPAGAAKSGDGAGSGTATGAEPPHATGVPGVMLAGDAGGNISGTFSATRQNVHLDGGTRVVLGVAAVR